MKLCVQVDFTERFRLSVQDAIQSSYHSNNSVSLFTCHVWHSDDGNSFAHASDDLSRKILHQYYNG
jgi:hypothetical protein